MGKSLGLSLNRLDGSATKNISIYQELMLRSSIEKLRRSSSTTDDDDDEDDDRTACQLCVIALRRRAKKLVEPLIIWADETLPILGTNGTEPVRQAWEAAGVLTVFYTAVMVPMQAAFESSFTPGVLWTVINVAADSFFLVDMCVSIRTAFLRDGALIQDSSRIAAHYLSGEFRLDLIVSLPYVWVLQPLFNATGVPVAARVVPLLRLLRTLVRLYRVESSGKLLSSSSALRFNPGLVRVGQLMLMLLLACHWAGCLWWLVGEIDMEGVYLATTDPQESPWAASEWVRNQPFVVRYAHCLLWGAGLMTTLMPFDVLPRTGECPSTLSESHAPARARIQASRQVGR